MLLDLEREGRERKGERKGRDRESVGANEYVSYCGDPLPNLTPCARSAFVHVLYTEVVY